MFLKKERVGSFGAWLLFNFFYVVAVFVGILVIAGFLNLVAYVLDGKFLMTLPEFFALGYANQVGGVVEWSKTIFILMVGNYFYFRGLDEKLEKLNE